MRFLPALLALLLPAAAPAAPFGPFGSPGHPATADAVFAPRLPKVPGDELADLRTAPTAAAPSGRAAPPAGRSHPFGLAFDFYRVALTRIDGPRCVHRPVCSVYAIEAAERRGPLGLFLAVDRLWRGGLDSPLRRLPRVRLGDGTLRLHDPLEFSDFFLEGEP
jgi:hypothetical protein